MRKQKKKKKKPRFQFNIIPIVPTQYYTFIVYIYIHNQYKYIIYKNHWRLCEQLKEFNYTHTMYSPDTLKSVT